MSVPPLVDIHCHFVPGVDDGARDLDDAIAQKDDLVGELNKGWTVGKRLLQFERSGIGGLTGGARPADPSATLVKVARKQLRPAFLQADMGITGANFALADSGTLGLVTNEGNVIPWLMAATLAACGGNEEREAPPRAARRRPLVALQRGPGQPAGCGGGPPQRPRERIRP